MLNSCKRNEDTDVAELNLSLDTDHTNFTHNYLNSFSNSNGINDIVSWSKKDDKFRTVTSVPRSLLQLPEGMQGVSGITY